VRHEVIPAEVMKLKAEPGGDLVLGGADLAVTFMRHDLIDEYRIYVQPILLGEGRPLFGSMPGGARRLHLAEARTFGSGVTLLRYERPAPAD
jgi:dihydrofolate reductase